MTDRDPLDHEFLVNILKSSITTTLDKYTIHSKDSIDRPKYLSVFNDFIIRFKPYMVFNNDALTSLTNTIFKDEGITDVVLTFRSIFFAYLNLRGEEYEDFFRRIVFCIRVPNEASTAIPKAITSRTTPLEMSEMINILKCCDYLVPIILMNLHLSVSELQGL